MSAAIENEDLEGLSLSMPAPRRGGASTTKTVDFQSTEPVLPAPAVEPNKARDSKASQRLGQYTIVKTLGEGSFGKVKLATHQVSGQKVALKIINRKRLVTRDMAGRIEREIQYLQLLRHPHIIKLCVKDPLRIRERLTRAQVYSHNHARRDHHGPRVRWGGAL